jgi:hypothetical protein
MTLWAYRDGQQIKVSANSGGIEVKVTEAPEHLRHFWGELGKLLEEAAQPAEPAEGGF